MCIHANNVKWCCESHFAMVCFLAGCEVVRKYMTYDDKTLFNLFCFDFSGDTANRICNMLEAIFLHELKDSYASKVS